MIRLSILVSLAPAALTAACATGAPAISADIGFATVAAARQSLEKEEILFHSVHMGEETFVVGGPLLKDTRTYWVFVTRDWASYPMASRFDFIREGDGFVLRESMLCEGDREACLDQLPSIRKDAELHRETVMRPKAFKY